MRIIAFGCSYTYGHGLPDCLLADKVTQGPTPSQLAFPNLVGNKLNCPTINLGKSGNSNKEIWNDILNFKFESNDIAIVTWTYYSRFCIIKSDMIRRISPWRKEEKPFYLNYSDRHDMVLDFYGRLNHVSSYLNNIGIQNHNFVIEYSDMKAPIWNQTEIMGKFEVLDKADDNCHPGIVSHAKFSDDIYTVIRRSST